MKLSIWANMLPLFKWYGWMMTNSPEMPTPQLGRAQVIKLGRLLNMYYRPSEIAELLDVNVDTVRRTYLAAGCPYRRDENGHIWIIGIAFKDWAEDVIAKRKRRKTEPMADDEAWCFKCNTRVPLIEPKSIQVTIYIELLQSHCPECGTRINRAQARAGDDTSS